MADIVFPGESAGGPLNKGAIPSNHDVVMYKGDFFRLMVTIRDSTGTPIDLTGAIPRAAIKASYDDRTSTAFNCTLVDAVNGQVEIFMSSSKTSELLPGSYIWDFQITFADLETRTYLAGDVTVYNEVTT